MPRRRLIFGINAYYHIFNRGVARQPIFSVKKDYEQAMLCLEYYLFTKPPMKLSRFKELSVKKRHKFLEDMRESSQHLVDIIAFTLMPNHVHFLLRQRVEHGISKYMSQFQNSYTRYFNTKYERIGPIFQGVFKGVHVETMEQLLHVSRYIHLNPVVSFLVNEKEPESYVWSSLTEYLKGGSSFLSYQLILNQFKNPDAYRKFIVDHIDYAKRLNEIKHVLIDNDME